ncbi:MAG: hypothetical protein P8X51_16640, partial [Maritimibacter sp.]
EQAVGTVFMRQGTRQHVLEVRFPERDEQLYSQRVRKLLRDLAPHLQNAAQTAQLKARFDKARSELDQTLGLIPFPAAIVDTECRVEKLNPLAENMLRNCQALILGADERLHGVETDDEIQLKRAVQEVGAGQANETRWLRFKTTERQAGLVLTLIHLDPRRRHVQADSAHRVHNRDLVAIIAQHRDESSKLSHDMLCSWARLCAKLAPGGRLTLLPLCCAFHCRVRSSLAVYGGSARVGRPCWCACRGARGKGVSV